MSSLARLRIDLAYDGGPFAGYARQRGRETVQGTLEEALERFFDQKIALNCAGRTDRGVHATAQVVHFDFDPRVKRAAAALADLEKLRTRLDQQAGRAIAIWKIQRVGSDFHARFSANRRSYRYRLVDTAVVDPILRFNRWIVGEPLSLAAMRRAARALVGEHDFCSFCRRHESRSTVRSLHKVTISRPEPGHLDLRFGGRAFCHQQVRAMVGCLVEVGQGKHPPEWVGEVLAARDRSVAARVAPAHGLTLEHVSYGHRWPAAPPRR